MIINGHKIIRNIILIHPLLYGLQDKIEREQENVVADMSMPAEKAVSRLIALDDRRIDLCNLKVLYAFIERGLRERMELLRACAVSGTACALYDEALACIALAGYTAARAEKEFAYLFELVKNKRRRSKPSAVQSAQIHAYR